MEKGLIIGYDLCKDYCRISYYRKGEEEPADLKFSDEDNPYLIQNSVCKKKGTDEWLVGQEAYETALFGSGYIVNKLLNLVGKKGFSTFDGVKYSAEDLLYRFLTETLRKLFEEAGSSKIEKIVFSVQELDATVLDAIVSSMKRLGVDRKSVHIISHTESYLYFVLSRSRDLWSNLAVLYDFSGDGLNYYEMELLRGIQPNVASAKREFLEEGVSIDILSSSAGKRMADSIMTSTVERMLAKKLVSACFLSGNGMDSVQIWGENFLNVLCRRRRVFFIENLFAKGAVYAALDKLNVSVPVPFRIMCEGRIKVDITVDVQKGLNPTTLTLARIGENWYETRSVFDIIPDQEQSLKLKVKKVGERSPVTIEVPFEALNRRGNKLTRIRVSLAFTQDNVFTVSMTDRGFGEIFKATEAEVHRTFTVE